MTVIKPCPFCGSRRIRHLRHEQGRQSMSCEDCGAMVSEFTRYKRQIVAKWNHRRPPSPA